MNIKSILKNLLRSGIEGETYSENVRKAMIINSFSFVSFVSLITFAISGIISSKFIYTLVVLFFLAAAVVNFLLFRKTKNCLIHGGLIVVLLFLLELILIIKLGDGITGIFWFYLFPLIAFFILGKKIGLYFTFSLILIAIILMYTNLIEGMTFYPNEIRFRFIFTYFAVSILAYIFENIRDNTYSAFMIADEKKSFYLTQVLQQKEEIQTQSEKLSETNIELEKLSLVASKTNNAVLILDKNGNFEWINEGFKRIYGFGIEKLKSSGYDFFQSSNNPSIKEIYNSCISEKKTVTYESSGINKNGYKIFVKTNLTPIFNENEELIKFVVIDTDITDLKEAEIEILQKTEEILAQKEEILVQKEALEEHNDKIQNQNLELEGKNEFIESQNEQIRSSIRAALTIQDSILPNLDILNPIFDNFVIFKPKDIVSGDFYWAKKIGDKLFVAVVDCTGHGVPGAFMSMIASQMLNDIVIQQKICDTDKILENLDKKIIKTLRQAETDNKNGMDAVIVIIENNLNLTFSGAKRPLFILRNSDKKIITEKGSRRSIGGFSLRYKENFESKKLVLEKNDVIYLTSDGYVDQNNLYRKRLGTERFINTIENIADKQLESHKVILEEILTDWMQDTTQRDDITIVGLKVK